MAQDEHTYGFSKPDAEELLQSIGKGIGSEVGFGRGKSVAFIIKTPVGGIAARVGSTITTEDCDVYSAEGLSLMSAGFTVPVGNISNENAKAEEYYIAVYAGGILALGSPISTTTVTVVTDVRVDGVTLQKKTRAITVISAGNESSWTTYHTGTTCP